jgi:hypothetical protein
VKGPDWPFIASIASIALLVLYIVVANHDPARTKVFWQDVRRDRWASSVGMAASSIMVLVVVLHSVWSLVLAAPLIGVICAALVHFARRTWQSRRR